MAEDKNSIDIDYVANLARIDLSQEEKDRFQKQLGDVLVYFEKLSAVDVEGVEPMAHPFPVYNVLEEDVVEEGFTAEEALMNAKHQRNNQVIVPKVVE
tara:strand:- start:8169 stop:8462 length:294 start_codon:yes stop_codon:yes gene_type:complete